MDAKCSLEESIYKETLEELNNKICALEVEKDLLLRTLKRKDLENQRISELIGLHANLLSKVNYLNKNCVPNKSVKTDLADIAVQTCCLNGTTHKAIQCSIRSEKSAGTTRNLRDFRRKLQSAIFLKEENNMEQLAQRLQDTKLLSGVTFAGKGLKLNSADDAKPVVDAIISCETLEYLNLEGNTIGVDAAVAISKALEKHPEFKQALWKDMFTGRLKEEIPKALNALCRGVMKSKAQLDVLDLSDNASGPIGVDGMAEFIKSPSCYTLKELRLNNMGLGITGAKLLSHALLECCNKSEEAGNPLKLKVFIAGRNRLEDEGIKALSQVFKKIGSLEELSVPQNSIYKNGIKVLSEALKHNPSLKRLNLNDNTLSEEGSKALANGLQNMRDLRFIDIGDCLIKTEGAFAIADMLADANEIQEVILSYNGIKTEGALAVMESLVSKKNLVSLKLDGNKFGDGGIETIRQNANKIFKNKGVLDSLEEDEGSEDDDDDSGEEEDGENDDDDNEDYDEEDESGSLYDDDDDEGEEGYDEEEEEEEFRNRVGEIIDQAASRKKPVDFKEPISASVFMSNPTMENLLALGLNGGESIIEEIKRKSGDISVQIEELIAVIMSVSSLLSSAKEQGGRSYEGVVDDHKITFACTDRLYAELFTLAVRSNSLSSVNNTLPVFLGLIKDEKTRFKGYNQESCIKAVKEAMKKDYFPKETSQLLEFIMSSKPVVKKLIQKGN